MAIGVQGIKKFQREFPERKPLIGMGAAIIFFISLIPVPAFTGTTSHPCGTPLVAILLGPRVTFALTGYQPDFAGGVLRSRRIWHLGRSI